MTSKPDTGEKSTAVREGIFQLGDFTLCSGEQMRDAFLSYVIHGRVSGGGDNVVVVLPSIGGDVHRLDFLIGPDLALDPTQLCIVAINCIGNGKSISPSNSKAQAGMKFPCYTIGDMVIAQHGLLRDYLGLERVLAIAGASMGGMQTLEWGVRYPRYMRALIALVPLAKTPAWTVAINETSRNIIMAEPAWMGGDYKDWPEHSLRAWASFMCVVASHTPEYVNAKFDGDNQGLIEWMERETAPYADPVARLLDPNDWIYQTWAYDRHDVSLCFSAEFGNVSKALASIEAQTLILGARHDLYNPVHSQQSIAESIVRCTYLEIPSDRGHMSSSDGCTADVHFCNKSIHQFLHELHDTQRIDAGEEEGLS